MRVSLMPERRRQLFEACVEGNASVVSAILDEGTDVDFADEDDVTAMQVAAANGHEHLIRLLVMRGAVLDKSNSAGWTPLLQAARHGHTGCVALLLQNQADVNARTNLGADAMTLAARGGHLQTCQLVEDYGIDVGFASGISGSTCEFTPAMAASLHSHDAVLRHLLDRGNDINYQTPTLGICSLMFAGISGHMTTAQILIERGADPNLTNVNGTTSLEIAIVRGNREVQNYLDRKTTRKPRATIHDVKPDIIDATRHGNIQRIREILEADITQRDACSPHDGATPLMFAAMAGRLDIGKLLVEKGCDVNKQDMISGWTALMQATFHGKKDMARYLISAGADVLICAKNGCTTFDMVTFMEDIDTDLCRLIASKATQHQSLADQTSTKKTTKSSINREDSTSTAELLATAELISEGHPKNGLKAWWNRMSNRFRNLKLGRTFNLNADQIPTKETEITMKNSTPAPAILQNSILNFNQTSVDSLFSTQRVRVEGENGIISRREGRVTLDGDTASAQYTMGMLGKTSSNPLNSTMKPIVPPFSLPPMFQTNGPKMPPISLKKSVNRLRSTPTLGAVTLSSRGFGGRSTLTNLARNPTYIVPKPTKVAAEVSPSASTEASAIRNGMSVARSKVASSASSSTGTLTAGSGENVGSRVTETTRKETRSSKAELSSAGVEKVISVPKKKPLIQGSCPKPVSPNSSLSNASTLTPSPSSIPKIPKDKRRLSASVAAAGHKKTHTSSSSHSDRKELPEDIGCVLQQLSLEKYQPIFEEQEVDMEAFLTLNDNDLKELGISNHDSRRQILATISELNFGKDRERQHYQQALTHFNSTLRPRASFNSGSTDILDFNEWNMEGHIERE